MDRLKRFALKKTADSLDKVLQAKAHFDKREEKKSNTKKILELKHNLSNAMFYGLDKDRVEAYDKIQILNRMLSEHELSSKDKKTLDEMIKWYNSK